MFHMPISGPITIASRGSTLALWQAEYVKQLLANHQVKSSILTIKTTGDRVQDRFLHEIGGKGLFVKEIEQALKDKQAHIAIHSLKDLPARTADEFTLPAILPRHRSGDLLILHPKSPLNEIIPQGESVTMEHLQNLPKLQIATGSLRRSHLLKKANPHIQVTPIRGNVDTRLNKLIDHAEWDGLILAEASLERLNLLDQYPMRSMDKRWFIPSSAQGALAIETLADSPLTPGLRTLNCPTTEREVSLERGILSLLGGDCTMPVGCHFYTDGTTKQITGSCVVISPSGQSAFYQQTWDLSPSSDDQNIMSNLITGLLDQGLEAVLNSLGIEAPLLKGLNG
jgi:hydroxymethylbilane synthase